MSARSDDLYRRYREARAESDRLRVEVSVANAEANRLIREARDAEAQDAYGVPYRSNGGTLLKVADDGSALYRVPRSAERYNYVIREPDGTERFVGRSLARVPQRGWREVRLEEGRAAA